MNTFKQQFDKLTEAYIKGEVEPYDSCGCFVGNLLNKTNDWIGCLAGERGQGKGEIIMQNHWGFNREEFDLALEVIKINGYTPRQISMLENCFMHNITKHINTQSAFRFNTSYVDMLDAHPDKEDIIFNAFSKTLDLLKEIHESKGEVVDKIEFKKRELVFSEN